MPIMFFTTRHFLKGLEPVDGSVSAVTSLVRVGFDVVSDLKAVGHVRALTPGVSFATLCSSVPPHVGSAMRHRA